jgi:RNA polymerase sigma-70 factor (ECF subfamily)
MVTDASNRASDGERSALRAAAQLRFDLGRAVWPQIALEFEDFERYFARHATVDALPPEANAADMYLACASAHAAEGALVALESMLSSEVARAVAAVVPSRAFVEDTLQAAREHLLVPRAPELGKIVDYAGRASLKRWLCAVAVRLAISRQRRKGEQGHQPFADEDDRRLAKGGPEFDHLRNRYQETFEEAVRMAVEGLPVKERMLLRLNLVSGMSIDQIGTAYKVGRSTAARWLASARSALLAEARRELRVRLHLSSAELDSIGAELRSHLDVSILRLLARETSED